MNINSFFILVMVIFILISCEDNTLNRNDVGNDNSSLNQDPTPVPTTSKTPVPAATPGTTPVILDPAEDFENTDAPETFTHESLDFNSPWGYNKSENSSRVYPLLVAGYWGEGDNYYRRDVEQTYPAFTLEYQKDSISAGEDLAEWVESAINSGYRIDVNRIYLTGFSRGGSGSFPLAKGMYAGGKPFAAIIRCAGQSQWDLTNDIAGKTAVWYHIGTEDTSTRVDGALTTLNNFRAYECNSGASESSETDDFTGYDRTTIKINRSGYLMFIYSLYEGMGHNPEPCYKDDALFPWLFSHSLLYR